MTINSIATTQVATMRARFQWLSGIRKGSVCPRPPRAVIRPQTAPRTHGRPRPVRLPSSDRASAKPMLMPAPTLAARPTRNVAQVLCVANAAANTGVGGLLKRFLVEALGLQLHLFDVLADRVQAQRPHQPHRPALHEALDVLAADERDVLAELLAVQHQQPVPVTVFLGTHFLER